MDRGIRPPAGYRRRAELAQLGFPAGSFPHPAREVPGLYLVDLRRIRAAKDDRATEFSTTCVGTRLQAK